MAGVTFAFIDIDVAILSPKAGITFTKVVVHLVNTFGSVSAMVCGALVNILFTQAPLVAGSIAVAMETTQFVDTLAAMFARSRNAVINIVLAEASRHSGYTRASEVIDQINAS